MKKINGVEYTTFRDLWNGGISLAEAEKDKNRLKSEIKNFRTFRPRRTSA
ncbi:MAG: hypothetical protein LBS62_09855 [Clostridiales bacterium]|nr:hypothetical protein [Clostridiales bacterium]